MPIKEQNPTLPWYVLYDRGIQLAEGFEWGGRLGARLTNQGAQDWVRKRWPGLAPSEASYILDVAQGLDPEDGEPWPIGRGDPRVYHHAVFRSPEDASSAVEIGRRIRPDIWWHATNKDGVWQAIGLHLSPDEMRPGQVPQP